MAKRVIILHGWKSGPEDCWFPWLKRELEARGFEVVLPELPEPAYPKLENWVPAVVEVVGAPDSETYFVGHSMGCQAILRYLETLPQEVKIGGAVFVGGFFDHLAGLREGKTAREFYASWFARPLDTETIRTHMGKGVAVFSDNDVWVPPDNQNGYRDKLGCEIVIEHNKGHFRSLDGITELPIVLEKILAISGSK